MGVRRQGFRRRRAGDFLRADVVGESILVVRGEDGELGAFYNVCRHRGAELVDTCGGPASGSFGAVIRCPYHSWSYGLEGGLRRAPFMEIDQPIALHPVGVDTWGGFVFVHLTPSDARPLVDQLGAMVDRVHRYPLAELRSGATFTYDVACNWKVIAENYNECYHCAPVHPELCDLVPAFRRGGAELGWVDGIPLRDGAWTFTATGTSPRAPFAGLDAAERERHKGELVYPNLLLSLSADHVAAYCLQPRGPADTRWSATCCSTPTRSPGRRSIRPTPATSGISSITRIGRSARACSAGCRREPGPAARTRRWRTSRPTSRAGMSRR